MDSRTITILYDLAEDTEKEKAEKEKKPFPLTYAQVADALEKRGHKVRSVPVGKKIRTLVSVIEKDESDVIFNLCEAIAKTSDLEHNICGLLELFEKRFTGAGSVGQILASDKSLSKKILSFHGVAYPRFCVMDRGRVDWSDDLELPLIVKPLNEAASIGIDKGSVVYSVKELLERIAKVQESFGGAALVEEFIEGREIYVGVIGNSAPEALPILEWDFSKLTDGPKIAGTEAKWDTDSDEFKAPEVFPEDLSKNVVKEIQKAAVAAYQALELKGYARVDMRLRKMAKAPAKETAAEPSTRKTGKADADAAGSADEWKAYVIEVNPNCWLEKRSEFAMAARRHGLSYPDLLERIMTLALEPGAGKPAQ